MNSVVPINTLESRIRLATDAKETEEIESIAKVARAWAKEQGDYEMFIAASHAWILARRKTTELSIPFAPKHGGDRKGEQYKNQDDIDVILISDFQFTPKQWSRRLKELEVDDGELTSYFDECIARQYEPSLFGLLKFKENPHVFFNSGENEWYTPPEYIAAARVVLGEIDLDPASSDRANEIVQAKKYYTKKDDGLTKQWLGRVWMNPPYSAKLVDQFSAKFAKHFSCGDVTEGIVLVNNATETTWFQKLISVSVAVVFTTGRVKFLDYDGNPGAPLQGQAIVYAGDSAEKFLCEFVKFGWGAKIC